MKKHLTIRMEEDLIEKLKIKAITDHTTITDILTEMVNKYLEEEPNMRTLEMQYEHGGESFEIWNTKATTLEDAWKEMDDQPTEGGWIRFKGSDEFMTVNGGFQD